MEDAKSILVPQRTFRWTVLKITIFILGYTLKIEEPFLVPKRTFQWTVLKWTILKNILKIKEPFSTI